MRQKGMKVMEREEKDDAKRESEMPDSYQERDG